MLAPGQTIDRYQLVCRIGDGGMAHVWAARQHGDAKLLALKIIHSRFAEHAEFRSMFLEEGRIVSAIDHRNVARVFELGERAAILYLAMEYVEGESLFALTAPKRTVPMGIALRIAADTCAGLHAVHRVADARGALRNVVHRDVSPQNILLTMSGEVKLIDFGIAHARDRAITTEASMVKGKLRYMAPEQARSEAVGPFTDVFGIGATLFRMLSGRAPYAAASEIETMQALLAGAPPTSALPPDLPQAVAEVVMKAIAPDLRDRYAGAKELEDDLRALVAKEYLPPDVGSWVTSNLSEQTRRRHAEVMASSQPGARVDLPPAPGGPAEGGPTQRQHQTDAVVTARPPPAAAAPAQAPAERARSFMDVGALAARARDAPGQGAPPHTGAGVSPEQHQQQHKPAGATTAKRETTASSKPLKLAVLAVVLVVVVVGVLLLLPRIARERAIAAAREAGFIVTIGRAGVGFSGVTFRDVTVKVARTPGITATIPEIHTTLRQGETRILGMDARIEGNRTDVEVGLAALLADNRARFAGSPSSPRHLSVVNARITWDGITGEGSRLSAGDLGVELDSRGAGVEDIKVAIGRFDVKTRLPSGNETTFGPWSASYERNATSSRVRLLLDPVLLDGPSVLVVWGRVTALEITVRVPRSPFSNLGIRPAELGLPAEASTEIDVNLHGKFPAQARSEVKGEVLLAGVKPPGFRGPVEIRVDGNASGLPGKPLDLERTTVTLGPFVAAISGTIAPHDNGLRLDCAFKTLPMPCAQLAQAEAKSMGPLAATLQALGQTTGALRVTGVVNAAGAVKYDTAEPSEGSLTWLARETCGVSIFGM